MPCFPPNADIQKIIAAFRDRFYANKSETEFNKILNDLINSSYNNWRIVQYDKFQKITNDIRP
jgi:phosphatidylinositol kinase/protein kinase (PI-3  family)